MGNFDGVGTVLKQGSDIKNNGVNGKLPTNGAAIEKPSLDEPEQKEILLNQQKFSAPAYTEIRTRRCTVKAAAEAKVSQEAHLLIPGCHSKKIVQKKCALLLSSPFCLQCVD